MKGKLISVIVLLALAFSVFMPLGVSKAAVAEHCAEGWLVKFEGDGTFYYQGVEINVSGPTVTFSQPVIFCVKAAQYNSGYQTGTSFTVDWLNDGGQTPDISYVVIYEIIELPEWCSPGYWKNHVGNWTVSTSTLFLAIFPGYTFPKGLTAYPTLLEVVSNPQIYGGPATNLVADYLSGMHPDVDFNFGDTRPDVYVCPLGR